jgi:23S rRNA pseudouridine955/2504/2580 synthase
VAGKAATKRGGQGAAMSVAAAGRASARKPARDNAIRDMPAGRMPRPAKSADQRLRAAPAPASDGGGAAAAVDGTGVRIVEVAADRDGQRLDNLLLGLLKGVPRTHVYRLLRTGQVRVNGKRAKPDTRVAAGDRLRVPPVRMAEPGELPRASAQALSGLERAIIREDRDWIALDKPSGLASHGGSGIALGAIEQLRQARPQDALELVHRLDRDTSGVLLIARKRSALAAAQAAIREGRARKRYLALLVGRLPQEQVRVDAPLRKSLLRGGERMVDVAADGKPSVSVFRAITRFARHTFVEVLIETGRTHQIRVHAAHLGLPVAGDDKYGDAAANRDLRGIGLRRLFLHAAELAFDVGETGRSELFSAPLPAELAAVLDALAGGKGA